MTLQGGRRDRLAERGPEGDENMHDGLSRVGETLPDVALPRLDGGEFRFADVRGKRLLLFMWGSW